MRVVKQLSYDTGVWMLTIQIGDGGGNKLKIHVDNKVQTYMGEGCNNWCHLHGRIHIYSQRYSCGDQLFILLQILEELLGFSAYEFGKVGSEYCYSTNSISLASFPGFPCVDFPPSNLHTESLRTS